MRLEQIDFKNKRASGKEIGVHDGFSLLTSWSAVTVLFCITFGVTYLALMLHDGAFNDAWEKMFSKPVKIEDKSWMLGDKKRFRPARTAPTDVVRPASSNDEQDEVIDPGPMAATTRVE